MEQDNSRIIDRIDNLQDIVLGMRQTLEKILYVGIALGVGNGALNVTEVASSGVSENQVFYQRIEEAIKDERSRTTNTRENKPGKKEPID